MVAPYCAWCFGSAQLIQDEQGTSVLDNILVNDLPTVGKPGNS